MVAEVCQPRSAAAALHAAHSAAVSVLSAAVAAMIAGSQAVAEDVAVPADTGPQEVHSLAVRHRKGVR